MFFSIVNSFYHFYKIVEFIENLNKANKLNYFDSDRNRGQSNPQARHTISFKKFTLIKH